MALLWMDGFDHFANINGASATATALGTAGYTATSSGTDGVLINTGRVAGAYAVRLKQMASVTGSMQRSFTSTEDKVVIGFAYMATERSDIVDIEGLIALKWPVGCQLNGVDGTAIPIRNIWYYYELVIDKTANTIALWINGYLDITAPLPAEGAAMTTFNVRWGNVVVNGAAQTTQYIDDLVFIDGSGANIHDRIGPIEITTRFPDADVTSEWEPAVAGPLYAMVNKRPPEAGSYIQSNVSGDEATFTSTQALPNDAQIFAIGIVARAMKTDIDNRQLGLVWGDGANRLEFLDSSLSTDNEYSYGVFEAPAAGQTWSKAIIEAQSFGVKVRP